jgi:hypothetical protein
MNCQFCGGFKMNYFFVLITLVFLSCDSANFTSVSSAEEKVTDNPKDANQAGDALNPSQADAAPGSEDVLNDLGPKNTPATESVDESRNTPGAEGIDFEEIEKPKIADGKIHIITSKSPHAASQVKYKDVYSTIPSVFYNTMARLAGPQHWLVTDNIFVKRSFVLSVVNGRLSPKVALKINGQEMWADELKEKIGNTIFNLNPVQNGVPQATKLDEFLIQTLEDSIANKGIHVVGDAQAVRDEVSGPSGEYRNGALVIQAVYPDKYPGSVDQATGAVLDRRDRIWEVVIFATKDP